MNAQRPSKNEARAAAREAARSIQAQQGQRARRNKILVQGGLGLLAAGVIVAIAAVMMTAFKPAGPGPLNMGSDGIRIGTGLVAATTDAIPADGTPTAQPVNADGVVEITIFLDYLCPICGEFEAENGDVIRDLIESGAATVEFRPLAILNNQSAGTQYSTRSANAAACVANYSPNNYFEFNDALFANQPAEGGPGLTDEELIALAETAGVASGTIDNCVTGEEFKAWTKAATERALSGTFAGNNFAIDNVTGTPTVLIDGEHYQYSYPFNKDEFLQAVMEAAGQDFSN
ncbi:MAG: DsbA family protein [Microbacteriaceae bacterium]